MKKDTETERESPLSLSLQFPWLHTFSVAFLVFLHCIVTSDICNFLSEILSRDISESGFIKCCLFITAVCKSVEWDLPWHVRPSLSLPVKMAGEILLTGLEIKHSLHTKCKQIWLVTFLQHREQVTERDSATEEREQENI